MLKTAQDYAITLHVHVNYLSRAVKETTGKSTTTFISERIISKAKALLQHTDWNVADIAYAPGFEYPPALTIFQVDDWNHAQIAVGNGSLKFLRIGLIVITSRGYG